MVLTPRRRTEDEGVVAVLTSVMIVAVVMPLLAIVVDIGLTRALTGESRTAADAAALAAAANQPVSATDPASAKAIKAAEGLVADNLPAPDDGWDAAWSRCIDPSPLPAGSPSAPGDCISFDYTLKQVRVTVPPRHVPTVFSGVLGTRPPDATATSTASWATPISPAVGTCALCVFTSYATGSEKVAVSGGDAAIGTSLTAIWPGSLQVSGGGITYGTSWTSWRGSVLPLPVRRQPPDDPFAAQLATLRNAAPYGQVSNPPPSGSCSPGVYQNISNCASFGPGTYFVTGSPSTIQTVTLNADANQVVLFLTCSASTNGMVVAAQCPSGRLPRFAGTSSSGGNPGRTLTAPGGKGLALVFDQGLSRTVSLTGASPLTINGDAYGPAITLASGSATATVNGRVAVQAVNSGIVTRGTMLVVNAPPAPAPAIAQGPVRLVRSE